MSYIYFLHSFCIYHVNFEGRPNKAIFAKYSEKKNVTRDNFADILSPMLLIFFPLLLTPNTGLGGYTTPPPTLPLSSLPLAAARTPQNRPFFGQNVKIV